MMRVQPSPVRAASFRRNGGWLRDALELGDGHYLRSFALLVGMIALSAICAVLTVVVGDAMPDRPIFYLALPLALMLAVLLATAPRQLLIGLVVVRAICDPVFQGAQLPGIGGIGGLLNVVIILLAVMLFVIERGWERTRASWLPWLPFITVMALGILRAPDKVFAVRNWLSLLTYASVFQGAFYCVAHVELDRMLRWVLLSAIPVMAYSVINYVLFGPSYVVDAGEAVSGRLSAPLGHPNILGFYLVVVLAAWLAKNKSTPGLPLTGRSIAWALYAMALLGVLAGTQARSAWVGAVVLIAVYGVFINRSYLVVMVIAGLLAMTFPDVRERVLDLTRDNEVYTYSRLNSYAWRQYLWSSALATMSPLSYVAGNGYGSFWTNSISFFPLAGGINWNAHNVYVQLLLDTGAIGVAAYLSLYAVAIAYLWQGTSLTREVRVVAITLVACFAVMSYSDNMLDYLVVNWNLWFIVGLVIASGTLNPATRTSMADATSAGKRSGLGFR